MANTTGVMIMCINDGLIFDTITSAAHHYHIDQGAISNQIRGKRKSVSGRVFYRIPKDMTMSELQEERKKLMQKFLYME
mgnify:FL=1